MNRSRTRRLLAAAAAVVFAATACSSDDAADDPESESMSESESEMESEPAMEGDAVSVGILHSLSGTMSISEVAVHEAELLAIDEINAAGGVLGMEIVPVIEDGASDWPTFAEKAEKLITQDEVAVVFGGWTSASRKAMLPVYEGLEASPNIFYTGATTNQQIVPALDYLLEEGMTDIYLVGSDYVFPRTANRIIKAYAEANGMNVLGEEYLPLGETATETVVGKVIEADPDVVFNTLNGDTNVSFFKELTGRGITSDDIQTMSVSVAEEEVSGIGIENIEGHLVSWNYYQTTDTPENADFVAAYKAAYGDERVTADPIEAGYNGVYIWAAAVEAAGTFEVEAVRAAAAGLTLETPEGTITVHEWNQHISKTARIGVINAEGLIDEVWNSGSPIEPDPCLEGYDWAEGLAQGECDR